MPPVMHAHSDPCPASAVSHGTGFSGMIGLLIWAAIAWHYGMDGPSAALTAVLACGLPMLLWSILVDKVHRRASTGIDWSLKRPLSESLDISLVKIAGLWATWGGIAVFYCLARWYWDGNYRNVMDLLASAAPWLAGLSIPYIFWLDRHLVEPRDGTFAFGQWVIGGAAGAPDMQALANHVRSWMVKGFFLAFMLSIVPGNFSQFIRWNPADVLSGPIPLANFLITFMFLIDVSFATVGYMLTMKPLDAHIRSAEPTLAGWVAALMCYPPFVLMGNGGPLDYHPGTAEWSQWLAADAGWKVAAQWSLGSVLVLLTAIYAWATVAFGLRFSNLTHRGVLTHGPYRWTRHPAYVSKNAFWWLSTLPFLSVNGSLVEMVRNSAIMAVVSGIYYWRARTEEAHLGRDPDYRAYSAWMERHAPVPRLIAWITGRSRPVQDLQPAE